MSRFYKSAAAMPLDYMYQDNIPLMERVVKANDKYIDDSLAVTGKLGDLAHFNHLEGDTEDAKVIQQNYTKQVDDITSAIQQDPANWRKQAPLIDSLKRTLTNDYREGAISKMSANYEKRKADFAAIDKQVELYHKSGGKKGTDPQWATLRKAKIDKEFEQTGGRTAFNPATGMANLYKGGTAQDSIDVRDRIASYVEKVKADENTNVKEDLIANGAYFNKEKHKWEGIRPEKLLAIINDAARGDSQLQSYLKEGQDIGYLSGAFDNKGQQINPFSYQNKPITPEEQQQVDKVKAQIAKTSNSRTKLLLQQQLDEFNNKLKTRQELAWTKDSYLAPIVRSVVNEHTQTKTDDENDLSNNSLFNTQLGIASKEREGKLNRAQSEDHFKQQQKVREDQARVAERAQTLREELAKDRKEHPELYRPGAGKTPTAGGPKGTIKSPATNGTTSSTTSATTPSPVATAPDSTEVSKINVRSLATWETRDKDNNPVPVLSNAGLEGDLKMYGAQLKNVDKELADLDNQIKLKEPKDLNNPIQKAEYNALKVKKNNLVAQRRSIANDYNTRFDWYRVGTVNAERQLQPEENEVYQQMKKEDMTGQKTRQKISELSDEYRKLNPLPSTGGTSGGGYVRMPELSPEAKKRSEEISSELSTLTKKLDNFSKAKDKVSKAKDNYFEGLRKPAINDDAIKFSKKDLTDVANIIKSNTEGLQIWDEDGVRGNNMIIKKGDFGGGYTWQDEKTLTFSGKNLDDYISKTGTTIVPTMMGRSTNLGQKSGAVVQVQFDDPTGGIPKDKKFFIRLTPELQKQITAKYKNSNNKDVANIANDIDDDFNTYIADQFIRPNTNASEDSWEFPMYTGNTSVPVHVKKIGNQYTITTPKGGKDVLIPSLNGVSGSFNSHKEFIESLKAYKEGWLDENSNIIEANKPK